MGWNDRNTIYDPRASQAVGTFSARVYGWMSIGLAFTAAIAFFVYQSGLFLKLLPFWWVWAIATFGVAMGFNASIQRFSIQGVIGMFLAYAGLEGIMFGTILPAFAAAYGGQVIWLAFVSAAAIFLLAMGYGMFTKNDLTSLGRILSIGLIGLIGLTLVFALLSLFMQLPLLNLLISYLGLVIFVGLAAYDAQTIRQLSAQADVNSVVSYKLSMVMALKMYINVIMIFWYLLRIFSSSNRR
ncbi:MAG: Bax inhibitor-1/YccA family protein [Chlamydiia bacterium]|nr:Bax inhibitor-1/YccA family protein [Chlamydiia bacterium]